MPSIILYSTLRPEGLDYLGYVSIWVDGVQVFVRGESHPGNLLDALDAASPREGETVLNAIPAEAV